MKCVFCEKPEIKEMQIVENDLAWAFLTNLPVTVGHSLICPKRCVLKYEDLTLEEKIDIESLRVKVCQSLKNAFGTEGFNFAWNDGEKCGQSVPHFHLHIVPRKEGDAGVYEYNPKKFLYRPGEGINSPDEELKKVTEIIKNNL